MSARERVQSFGGLDYLKITVLGFATAALWGSLHTIILPVRVLDFAPESLKNTYLGILTFVGLVLAMFVQPVAGAVSDASGYRMGRRRPYILLGTALAIVLLPGIGFAGSYLVLFVVYCLLQVSSNLAQGPYQAFIPDLVPLNKRGLASGVKNLMEIGGGVAFLYIIGIFMDKYSPGKAEWLWLALSILGAALLAMMVLTVTTVSEKPAVRQPFPIGRVLSHTFKIDIRKNSRFGWFLVSRLLVFMSFTTLQSFSLYFLRDVAGVADPAGAAARFSIVAVAGMLLAVYPAGRLSDRTGRLPVSIGASLLGAVSIGLIFIFQREYIVVTMLAGLVGLSFGAFASSNWALATDLAPKGEEARYMGLVNLATAGGAALARLIGPVIDFFGRFDLGLGYSTMLLACLTYFIVGSALLLKVRQSQSQ